MLMVTMYDVREKMTCTIPYYGIYRFCLYKKLVTNNGKKVLSTESIKHFHLGRVILVMIHLSSLSPLYIQKEYYIIESNH